MSIQRGVGAGRGNPPTVDGDMALRWVEPRALKTHTREPGFIFRLCSRLQLLLTRALGGSRMAQAIGFLPLTGETSTLLLALALT